MSANTATPFVPATTPARGKRTLFAILLAALIVGGVIWWYAGLRNLFFPDNFGVVEPGRIFRSAQIHRRIIRQTLLDHHIKVIVDLSLENSPNARAERKIAAELGIRRIQIKNLAGTGVGDPNGYTQAIEAIVQADRQGEPVLVHCQSGAERTGGVIATYRILVEGKSKAQAFAEAQRYHHRPHGNSKLYPFIETNLPTWKAQLTAAGIVPGLPAAGTESHASTSNP